MKTDYVNIGKRLPRVDGIVKVTGEAKYAGDLSLPGMLHGKILRSPHPHARIINIDTSRAKALPGVRAVVTGKDLPVIHGESFVDEPHIKLYDIALYERCIGRLTVYDAIIHRGTERKGISIPRTMRAIALKRGLIAFRTD